MQKILRTDQRRKQNHKEKNLLALHREQFLLGRALGLMLNQGNIHSPIMKYRRKWCIFFVTHNMCIEKKIEPFNSWELEKIFRHFSCIAFIGLIASGKCAWREEEETTKDSSTVLILQEQLCISELFKEHSGRNLIDPSLQDNSVISSNFFQYIYHIGCAFNLHSIINNGLIPGGQNSSKWQTVFFRACWSYGQKSQGSWKDWLDCTTSCTIPAQCMEETSERSVLDRHQSCFKKRIEVPSNTIERCHSSRNTSSLLYSESCQDGNWRSHIRESIHVTSAPLQRSPWNTNEKEDWVQNMLNDQKLGDYLGVSNRTNQIPNPSRERTEMEEERHVLRRSMLILFTKKLFLRKERRDPLLKQTQKMCQIVLVMKAKHSTLEIKHFVKERWDPLLTMTIQVMSKQCWTRWTWTSEFQDYHILLWNMRRVPAFKNWFRKLRTTQIDTLNKIYDKIKQKKNRLVQNQRKWFRKWATSNCSRRLPKRSAQHASHTGM